MSVHSVSTQNALDKGNQTVPWSSAEEIVQACQSTEDSSSRIETCNERLEAAIRTWSGEQKSTELDFFKSGFCPTSWEKMIHCLLDLLEEEKTDTPSLSWVNLLGNTCFCIVCGLPLNCLVDFSRIVALLPRVPKEGEQPEFLNLACTLVRRLILFGFRFQKERVGEPTRLCWNAYLQNTDADRPLLDWMQQVVDLRSKTDQQEQMKLCLAILHGLVRTDLVDKKKYLIWLFDQLQRCLWSPSPRLGSLGEAASLTFEDLLNSQTWERRLFSDAVPSQRLGFFPYEERRAETLMTLFKVMKSLYEVYSQTELSDEINRLVVLSALLSHSLELYQKPEQVGEVLSLVKKLCTSEIIAAYQQLLSAIAGADE